MFGQKQAAPEPGLLDREARFIAHLNKEAYGWLGKRYEWYNKIRTAKKGGLKLFSDASLEEQMEATRSALNLVSKTLNGSLATAFNGAVDAVKNAQQAPEGWPSKMERGEGDPPPLTDTQDAVILGWTPLKFLNLAKPVRDRGKGLDFYSDGLIKKLYFKVIGFYTDPHNWDPMRLGYFLQGLEADTDLPTVQNRLSGLRTDAELLAGSLQLFRFGRVARRADAGQKNAIDDLFQISDEELLNDLYFQSLLYSGLEHFLFRYYLTLLSATTNRRALRQISQIMEPVLAKMVELHMRFQTSFATEREKIRMRKPFLEYSREREALPPVEVTMEGDREVRRVHYTHRLLETTAFSRGARFNQQQAQQWAVYLKRNVIDCVDDGLGQSRLFEILTMLVLDTQAAMEGKVRSAKDLREFADEQEKLGKVQLARKKKLLEETLRNKRKDVGKFRAQEQMHMVETIQKEMDQMESQGRAELEALGQGITKRREAMIARVEQLELAAKADRERNQGKNAAALYALILRIDPERKLRGSLVPLMVRHVQDDAGDHAHVLYRNLFSIMGDLAPTEKMVLRSAIGQKVSLEPGELEISEEELDTYRQQIMARKTDLNMEAPGVLEQRLVGGPVQAKLDDLLGLGLTVPSLRLLLSVPFAAPNKAPAKLPVEVVRKVILINQLAHPLPEHDLVLPNVDAALPALKRINFNRLKNLLA